jgi:tRNA threonylcarbamoyl adenosine modification protein YeaZ
MNLYVDTSNAFIIFVLFNQDNIFRERIIKSNRNQSEIFVDEISNFLLENDLYLKDIDNFFFAKGPGSFTGVRVGLSYAKALKVSGYNNIYTINSLYSLIDIDQNMDAYIDARGNKSYYIKSQNSTFSDSNIIDNEEINFEQCQSYETALSLIPNNIRKIYNNKLYDDNLDILYLKQAF